MEISTTSNRLEAEEALNAGLQRKNKEFQVRPHGRAAAFLSFSAVGVCGSDSRARDDKNIAKEYRS